ncbi:MAG TPA: TonB-dependent receptor [Pedobacter sp.]|uniref:TonB-dependent receptor n=1 Tax=Pedobacter sp. TaxID=1411316 RepID=UPI002CA5D4B2|nr:TonB-dependent receptor [Pedobacter sp.]HMI02679.1 TonB-dependent receptor [Pedobacter sp.]
MRSFLTCLLLLLALSARAQILTVKDKATQQPIAASVKIGRSTQSIKTNADGQLNISKLNKTGSIFITGTGYREQMFTYNQLEEMNFIVSLSESNISLDAVVISGSRWRQSKREVPNKITTVLQKDIVFQNPQTTADLLAQSGEVYIQKSQMTGGSPMIRGFATNRVLLTVDGVRMNTAIFRSGNLQNVISLDPLATESVEILFGPGSVIYGSDAIGGVMNFNTLSPNLSVDGSPYVTGSALTRWSSANSEKTGHVDFNIGLKKWAFLTTISYSDFDDLKMGSRGPAEYLRPEYAQVIDGIDTKVANSDPEKQVPTAYNQINLMEKITFKPNEDWNFNYGLHYSTSSDNPRYDNLLRYKGDQLRSAEWYYGPQKWLMNNLSLTSSKQHKLYDNMKIGLAHQFFEESRHDRNFGSTSRTNNVEKVNALSANLDLEKILTDRHSIYYGAEIIYNKINSTGTLQDVNTGISAEGPIRYPNNSDWSSYAAFLTYRYNVAQNLVMQTGMRYNHFILNAKFNDKFYPFPFTSANINQGALTGSAGLVYSPAASWQISTNLSTGFRSPNIDDIGKIFESAPGMVVVPNPGLKAEYAYNGDLGIAKTFGTFVKLDATAFYTHLDDALVRRDFTLNGSGTIIYDGESSQVQAIQNAANAHVWGIQAGLEIKLPLRLGLNSRFNYQNGEEELDDGTTAPLRHAAPWFGTSHLTYSQNKLKGDFYIFYNGEVSYKELAPSEGTKTYMYAIDTDGNPYSPSWITLNFKASYQLTDHLMLNAGLENITDKRYRPYSSGIVSAGRNLIVSIRASF